MKDPFENENIKTTNVNTYMNLRVCEISVHGKYQHGKICAEKHKLSTIQFHRLLFLANCVHFLYN